MTDQDNVKFNSSESIFIKYFVLTGMVSNVLFNIFPTLGIVYFFWVFFTFVDNDFEDPETPEAIRELPELDLHLFC